VTKEELEQVSQTRQVKDNKSLQMEARNHARQVVGQWVNDQLGVRDAEIMWMQRRRQLLLHEKVQIRKWQTRAYNRCMKLLSQHEGAEILAITPDILVWKGADGWENQEMGVDLNLEEGPDPLQFTLEEWVDQRRD
jgi:hypothetical protein